MSLEVICSNLKEQYEITKASGSPHRQTQSKWGPLGQLKTQDHTRAQSDVFSVCTPTHCL